MVFNGNAENFSDDALSFTTSYQTRPTWPWCEECWKNANETLFAPPLASPWREKNKFLKLFILWFVDKFISVDISKLFASPSLSSHFSLASEQEENQSVADVVMGNEQFCLRLEFTQIDVHRDDCLCQFSCFMLSKMMNYLRTNHKISFHRLLTTGPLSFVWRNRTMKFLHKFIFHSTEKMTHDMAIFATELDKCLEEQQRALE